MAEPCNPTRIQVAEEKLPPWRALRSVFSCKYHQTAVETQQQQQKKKNHKSKKIGCSVVSLCSQKESSRVMQRPEPNSPDAFNPSDRSMKTPLQDELNASVTSSSSTFSSISSSSSSSVSGSFRGLHLRRLSGCYECHLVVDPSLGISRDPSLRTPTLFSCSDCEEMFTKADSLELHQSVRHAVSELGTEETSRKIVEIIFQSSWLKKHTPICKIERILKVNNTKKTRTRFEDYRDCIKLKANKLTRKHPRCIADGNELLRFHCTTFNCSLGLNGSSNLCNCIPHCNLCSIIRVGFKPDALGMICSMATSGTAHDSVHVEVERERAMLVCRVIAGRVRKSNDAVDECDSLAGSAGVYSNLDELFVFDPRAILPCFVVIYSGF